MKNNIAAVMLAACWVAVASAATPLPLKGSTYLAHAKVPLKRAQSLALAKEHGVIIDQELEPESGGSGLRYSFDINVGNAVREVGIDAATGAVLEDRIDDGKD